MAREVRARSLSLASMMALSRLLAERGLSEPEIERGLEYVADCGGRTMRESFVLAMSRVTLSDEQLAAGSRFTFEAEA